MDDADDSQPLDPDPEIAALLDFEPVPRKHERRDGWTPGRQRGFIAALAATGNQDLAAHQVGLTARGAYNLRKSAGAREFADAWIRALDLYQARNRLELPPPQPSRTAAGPAEPSPPPPPEPEIDVDALWAQFQDGILVKYLLKLDGERQARLDGRIVEADFCVRQLTWLEVALDLAGLGDKAVELLKGLARGEHNVRDIAATPVSLLLDRLRRDYWERADGLDRPPLPPLGHHDEEAASGPPLECQSGVTEADRRERESRLALQAEAQLVWEEKAKAEAEARRKRTEGERRP